MAFEDEYISAAKEVEKRLKEETTKSKKDKIKASERTEQPDYDADNASDLLWCELLRKLDGIEAKIDKFGKIIEW